MQPYTPDPSVPHPRPGQVSADWRRLWWMSTPSITSPYVTNKTLEPEADGGYGPEEPGPVTQVLSPRCIVGLAECSQNMLR
ncbi:hypothetical protein DPEC_G00291070 [Dallia pectoralis]|uniref:Uncharacterized protein n=1 Tax=Dallia pectoralis TaxID=75939 RepID=A0ACC2FHL4_DALPE|nr:hypothetical protein DPEC_G00291070 [Dallia pectoralis]